MTLNYQPGKANVVADALSRKSYCNTLMVERAQPALHEEFTRLNLEIVLSGYLVNLEIKSTLEDDIKAAQQNDAEILEIKEKIASGKANCFSVDDNGVVYFGNRLVVPKSGNTKGLILSDRKSTRLNSSHSGESRMPSSA